MFQESKSDILDRKIPEPDFDYMGFDSRNDYETDIVKEYTNEN